MNEPDELVRIPEAISALRISRSKLYLMMAAGQVAYTKLGRCRRIPRSELDRLIRRNTVPRKAP
jgi:excisionase family DNA binding protein